LKVSSICAKKEKKRKKLKHVTVVQFDAIQHFHSGTSDTTAHL
jgi:hypothetical protein